MRTEQAGLVPPDVMPFIAGADLTALTKKNGDIRPIAAGDTLRRLTAKCLCSLVREAAASYFLPCQLGVAFPGGAESIIHGLRVTWENSDGLDIALLKVDFCNAFNCVSHQVLLDECLSAFPGIYKWAKWCYSTSCHLFYNYWVISSSSGVQQGDPLGSLLFCLVLHKLVMKIETLNANPLANCSFIDDGCVVGTPGLLAAVINHRLTDRDLSH